MPDASRIVINTGPILALISALAVQQMRKNGGWF